MQPVVPPKLRAGAHIRVVAPSTSMSAIPQPWRDIADARMADLGLTVSFGAHADELDVFESSPVASRIADLHDAFADGDVHGILTFIGGYHANQLLDAVDFDLVRANPKVFCGYSDITVLQHAMLAASNLVTYSGLHWSTFGMREEFDQNLTWFRACLFDDAPYEVRPSRTWTDDAWYLDQDDRRPEPGQWWVLREGTAERRTLVGGNLCTLNLLQGTRWWPSQVAGALLVVEDDFESTVHDFARDLQSLLHAVGAEGVRGLVIGRFQRASGMTREHLEELVARTSQLDGVPVIANVDVGHTNPVLTYPVGGDARLDAHVADPVLTITRH